MTARRDDFDETVQAFRDATARPADGRATRARLLAAAEGRARAVRRARPRAAGALAALVVVLSAAGAFTAIGRWRAASTARQGAPVVAPSARPSYALVAPAPPTAPPPAAVAPPPTPPTADPRDEERAYGRAHRLHFGDGEPRAALAAWNEYLSRHPHGAFVPEARYNRALTLLRLGRTAQAVEALRPFAAGAFGAYRREEAALLIQSVTP